MNNNYFDLVIIWHVLEHLNDPINAMDRISNLLDDNSILVISVPNYSSFQSRIFKSNWFHLDIPRHLYHFNKSSLLRLLEDKDFTVLKINTCSLEQGIFGFIQSTFNSLGFMGKPNRFYQTLKRQPKDRNLFVFASGLVGSILLLPFAVLEHFFSCLTSSGSVITIIAQKKDKRKT